MFVQASGKVWKWHLHCLLKISYGCSHLHVTLCCGLQSRFVTHEQMRNIGETLLGKQLKIQLVGLVVLMSHLYQIALWGSCQVFGDDDSFLKYTSIHLRGFVLKVVPRPPALWPKDGAHIPRMGSTRQRWARISEGSNLNLETFHFPVDTPSNGLVRNRQAPRIAERNVYSQRLVGSEVRGTQLWRPVKTIPLLWLTSDRATSVKASVWLTVQQIYGWDRPRGAPFITNQTLEACLLRWTSELQLYSGQRKEKTPQDIQSCQ